MSNIPIQVSQDVWIIRTSRACQISNSNAISIFRDREIISYIGDVYIFKCVNTKYGFRIKSLKTHLGSK